MTISISVRSYSPCSLKYLNLSSVFDNVFRGFCILDLLVFFKASDDCKASVFCPDREHFISEAILGHVPYPLTNHRP